MSPTLAAIHRLEKDFAFVLNQTPPKGFRVRDTSEGLKVLGMLADVAVVSRTDHQDAIGAGQGVTEFNPTAPRPARSAGYGPGSITAPRGCRMSKPPKTNFMALIAGEVAPAARPEEPAVADRI